MLRPFIFCILSILSALWRSGILAMQGHIFSWTVSTCLSAIWLILCHAILGDLPRARVRGDRTLVAGCNPRANVRLRRVLAEFFGQWQFQSFEVRNDCWYDSIHKCCKVSIMSTVMLAMCYPSSCSTFVQPRTNVQRGYTADREHQLSSRRWRCCAFGCIWLLTFQHGLLLKCLAVCKFVFLFAYAFSLHCADWGWAQHGWQDLLG